MVPRPCAVFNSRNTCRFNCCAINPRQIFHASNYLAGLLNEAGVSLPVQCQDPDIDNLREESISHLPNYSHYA
jgi:hypothetical protein